MGMCRTGAPVFLQFAFSDSSGGAKPYQNASERAARAQSNSAPKA